MTLIKTIDLHNSDARYYNFGKMSASADGRILLCPSTRKRAITAVDTITGEVHEDVLVSHATGWDWQVWFSPTRDSCVVVNGRDMFVLALPACKQVLGPCCDEDDKRHQHTDEITCCVWHPQYAHTRQFVTGSKDCTVRLWQLNAGESGSVMEAAMVRVFGEHEGPVGGVVICTDDQGRIVLATAAQGNGVQLWNMDNGASPIQSLTRHRTSSGLLWLPRQRLLACYSGHGQKLECRSLSGELVRAISLTPKWMMLHPSEKYLVVPSYGGFQLLDADTLEVAFQSFGRDGQLDVTRFTRTVRMTADGQYFVSQSTDNAFLLHDWTGVPL